MVLSGPVVPGPLVPGPAKLGPVVPGPLVPGPAKPGPLVPGPLVPGPAKPGPVVPGPVVAGPVVPVAPLPGPNEDGSDALPDGPPAPPGASLLFGPSPLDAVFPPGAPPLLAELLFGDSLPPVSSSECCRRPATPANSSLPLPPFDVAPLAEPPPPPPPTPPIEAPPKPALRLPDRPPGSPGPAFCSDA